MVVNARSTARPLGPTAAGPPGSFRRPGYLHSFGMSANWIRLAAASAGLALVVVVIVATSGTNDEPSSSTGPSPSETRPVSLSGYSNILVVYVKSLTVRELTRNRDEELAQGPTWSANGRIAFTQASSDESPSKLFLTNGAGSTKTLVRAGPTHVFQPTWSPDGRKLAVVRLGFGIYSIELRSGDSRRLSNEEADEAPAWSPKGKPILFDKQVSGTNWDLFAMDTDGGNVRRLTRGPLQETNPTWSPDGSSIAFAQQERNGNWVIYKMKADGSSRTRLTDDRASSQEPAWSPDGSRIAFIRQAGARAYVTVMKTDGSGLRRLTGNSLVASRPSWSPDGTQLVFSAKAASTDPDEFGHGH
jgi:Tol biopolymer transport system component